MSVVSRAELIVQLRSAQQRSDTDAELLKDAADALLQSESDLTEALSALGDEVSHSNAMRDLAAAMWLLDTIGLTHEELQQKLTSGASAVETIEAVKTWSLAMKGETQRDPSSVSQSELDTILQGFTLSQSEEQAKVDPRKYEHIECDCVPDLGPSHCHLCSERLGKPISWDDTTHPFHDTNATGIE